MKLLPMIVVISVIAIGVLAAVINIGYLGLEYLEFGEKAKSVWFWSWTIFGGTACIRELKGFVCINRLPAGYR